MSRTRVLELLPLFIGLAHSFSWDIIDSEEERLNFYYNGAIEHTEDIRSAIIDAITYDPVNDRVLYADRHGRNTSIFGFDISTKEIQPLVSTISNNAIRFLVYDPITQLLFWQEGFSYPNNIYSFSLKPGSSDKTVEANLFVTLNTYCGGIAVDSCGGFIYWATDKEIERAKFDGSRREVLLVGKVFWRRSFAIDQQTQAMYWTEEKTNNVFSIESADLNGNNRRTFYFIGTEYGAGNLAVSKDFIYWKSYVKTAILRLPKSQQGSERPTIYSNGSRRLWTHQVTAANYTIKEQTLGIKSCEALNTLVAA